MAGEQRTWQVMFKLWLLLHTQARENARTLADLAEAVEALFQKVPPARQRLSQVSSGPGAEASCARHNMSHTSFCQWGKVLS